MVLFLLYLKMTITTFAATNTHSNVKAFNLHREQSNFLFWQTLYPAHTKCVSRLLARSEDKVMKVTKPALCYLCYRHQKYTCNSTERWKISFLVQIRPKKGFTNLYREYDNKQQGRNVVVMMVQEIPENQILFGDIFYWGMLEKVGHKLLSQVWERSRYSPS